MAGDRHSILPRRDRNRAWHPNVAGGTGCGAETDPGRNRQSVITVMAVHFNLALGTETLGEERHREGTGHGEPLLVWVTQAW